MLAAAVQEHERGLGNWPAEWETLPEIVLLAAGALDAMANAVATLNVDIARMRANLDLTQGQLLAEAVQMALAPALGRDAAHALVADACRQASARSCHLQEILASDPKITGALDEAALERLFDPSAYLGTSDAFIDRVLAGFPAKGS
jgi:3-carboxy-cis,cis-muconate cycloisomerase